MAVALGPGARGGLEQAAASSHAGGAHGGFAAEPDSDELLARRCRAGDPTAFDAIVKRHERQLVRHCARLVGEGAAQDAAQDAFLAAWRAMAAGAEIRSLRPWLYTIAHRKAIAILREQRRQPRALPDALAARVASDDEASQRARVRDALEALAALPDPQREALVGVAVHGRSGRQLARQLGIADYAVRQLVYRARETLRAGAPACLVPPLLVVRLLRRVAAAAHRGAVLTASGGPGQLDVTTGLVRLAAAAAAGAAVAGGVVLSSSAAPLAHRTLPPARAAGASRLAAGVADGVATRPKGDAHTLATSDARSNAGRDVIPPRSAIAAKPRSASRVSAAPGGSSSGATAADTPPASSDVGPQASAIGANSDAGVHGTDATSANATRTGSTRQDGSGNLGGTPDGAAKSTADAFTGTVNGSGDSAAAALSQGVGAAADVVSTVTQGAAGATQGVVSTVTQGAAGATQGAVSAVTQGAAGVTQGVVSTVTQGVASATQGVVSTVTQTGGDTGSTPTQPSGSSATQTAASSVTAVAGSVVQGAASSIAEPAGSIGQSVSGSTKKTPQGLTGAVGQSLS